MELKKHGRLFMSLEEFAEFVNPPYKEMPWYRLLPSLPAEKRKNFKIVAQKLRDFAEVRKQLEKETEGYRKVCIDCGRFGFAGREIRCQTCKSNKLRFKRKKIQKKIDKMRRKSMKEPNVRGIMPTTC